MVKALTALSGTEGPTGQRRESALALRSSSAALRPDAHRQLDVLTLAHATALTWPVLSAMPGRLSPSSTQSPALDAPRPAQTPPGSHFTDPILKETKLSWDAPAAALCAGVGFWVINPSCRRLQMLIDSILNASPTCWHGQPPPGSRLAARGRAHQRCAVLARRPASASTRPSRGTWPHDPHPTPPSLGPLRSQ